MRGRSRKVRDSSWRAIHGEAAATEVSTATKTATMEAATTKVAATATKTATTVAATAAMRRSSDRDVSRPATGMRSSPAATMCVCRAEHTVSRVMPRKCRRPAAGSATGNDSAAKTRAGGGNVISAAALVGGIMHPHVSGENGAAANRGIEGRIDNDPTPGPIDITPAPYRAIRSKLDSGAEPYR